MCNVDPDVISIDYQPICIEYNYAGKRRKYTPEFLLIMSDKSRENSLRSSLMSEWKTKTTW
ncbi:TnsA endonuclease N-terminal domain-containing protein [Paenibacillus harenae]|uniref:TnsA endonuclease N-terminal domain-containing protein n=1 Tax=Paenibacillus harenae TaxID=306543 RepID=UPI00048E1526